MHDLVVDVTVQAVLEQMGARREMAGGGCLIAESERPPLDIGQRLDRSARLRGVQFENMARAIKRLSVIVPLTHSSTPTERRNADRILPIISRHHLLLVTLLFVNCIVNEALPIFLDRLVSEYAAIALSVSLVLIVGEILPQAVGMRFGLAIGARELYSVFVRTLFYTVRGRREKGAVAQQLYEIGNKSVFFLTTTMGFTPSAAICLEIIAGSSGPS